MEGARRAESIANTRLNTGGVQGVLDPNAIERTNKALDEQERMLQKNLDAQKEWGMSSDLVTAKQEAEARILDQKMNPAQAERELTMSRAAVLNR